MISKRIKIFYLLSFILVFPTFLETNEKSYSKELSEDSIEKKIEKKNYSIRMKVAIFSTIISSFFILTLILKIKSMEKDSNYIYKYQKEKK